MNGPREMRASDSDRQAAVDRLRAALDEGRLDLYEYDRRLMLAYQAVTYGDLEDLFTDLPAAGQLAPATTAPRADPAPGLGDLVHDLPTALKVLWTIWLSVVSINLVVWFLVSLSNGDPEYFWPMWVAGPSGAALFGVSVGTTLVRRGRRARRLRARAERQRRDERLSGKRAKELRKGSEGDLRRGLEAARRRPDRER